MARWLLVALLLALPSGGCGGAPTNGSASGPLEGADTEHVSVTDRIHQLRYERHWSTWMETSEGIVVIDPHSNAAAAQLASIVRERDPTARLAAVVYSHWHLDHATGAEVLRRELGPDAPIVAHERTVEKLRGYHGRGIEDVPLPTRTVGDGPTELTFGDTTLELRYLGHAHQNDMLVVRIPSEDTLYACDFVRNEGVAYSDLPGVDMHEQVAQLYRLLQLEFEPVIFCHTPPGDREAIRSYLTYIEILWTSTQAAIAGGLGAEAAVERLTAGALADYRDWRMADEWLAPNVRGMYRWLTAHPEAERPTGATPIPDPDPDAREPIESRPTTAPSNEGNAAVEDASAEDAPGEGRAPPSGRAAAELPGASQSSSRTWRTRITASSPSRW